MRKEWHTHDVLLFSSNDLGLLLPVNEYLGDCKIVIENGVELILLVGE